MNYVFPREAEHWSEGDLAYCVSSHMRSECTARLEKGRVYRVSKAVKPSNIMHHALRFEGFEWTGPNDYVWSNRFVKLGPVGGRLAEIDHAVEYTIDHYYPWRSRNAEAELLKARPEAMEDEMNYTNPSHQTNYDQQVAYNQQVSDNQKAACDTILPEPSGEIPAATQRIRILTERLYSITTDVQCLSDRLLGPRPETNDAGRPVPVRSGAMGDLDDAIDYLEAAISRLGSEAQRTMGLA